MVRTQMRRALVACLGISIGLCGWTSAQQEPPAAGNEAALIAVLKSDAPRFDKAKACQALAVIGTAQSVPVLATMLDDPELSHPARTSLEAMTCPEAAQALRGALDSLQGDRLIGVINSLGMKRDQEALGVLTNRLDGDDPKVAAAAAAALGRIASTQSVGELSQRMTRAETPETLLPAIADALLTAARSVEAQPDSELPAAVYAVLEASDRLPGHMRIAALENLIRRRGVAGLPLLVESLRGEEQARFQAALGAAYALPADTVAPVLVQALPMLKQPLRQAIVIEVLGDLGQESARSAVLAALASEAAPVRLAAIHALGKLGTAADLPALLQVATGSDETQAAAASDALLALKGDGVDAALAALLESSSSSGQGPILIKLAGQRGITGALGTLLGLADSTDPATREAAIEALGLTVRIEELPILVDRLTRADDEARRGAAATSLATALQRMPDRDQAAEVLIAAMASASNESSSALMDMLGVLGGTRALQAVATAAKGEPQEQDNASRVLGRWMTADSAPVLLEMARSGDEKYRVRALRGFLRVARQLDVPTPDRIAMCREVFVVAARDDERKLACEVLARNPTPEGLELAVGAMRQTPAIQAEAAAAAIAIAEALGKRPRLVEPALQAVIDAGVSDDLTARARAVLERLQEK